MSVPQLLNLTHDTIFVRDINDVITFWNRGAEELYGWESEQAVGKVTHQLMQTIFPARLEVINAELLRTGRWEGELVHTKTRRNAGRGGEPMGVAARRAGKPPLRFWRPTTTSRSASRQRRHCARVSRDTAISSS